MANTEIEGTHKHYFHQLLFNNVAIHEDMTSCNRKEQNRLMKSQAKKSAKDYAEGYKYLLYTNSNMCIYCLTTTKWLRSSDAVATRDFMVTEVSIEEVLGVLPVSHDYLRHEEVKEIFDSEVVSSCKVSQFMQQLDSKVDEVLRAVGNQKNLPALDIRTMMRESVMSSRELNYELPYNEWLFELVKKN